MIEIKPLDSIDALQPLKLAYMEQVAAPLDGMWLQGFVPFARHYGLYADSTLVGFCCVNEEGYMLQFHLQPQYRDEAATTFSQLFTSGDAPTGTINGAFASTAEPQYFSLCLDHFSNFTVNALMYQLLHNAAADPARNPYMELTAADIDELDDLVDFVHRNLGASREWLTEYYTNLINRTEVFCHKNNGGLLAIGECRGYDEYQTTYVDLGVIVDQSARGRGLATKVLRQLVALSLNRGLTPICSTESGNIPAQKAISRAGFFAPHRIVRFDV